MAHKPPLNESRRIVIRDSTLREGLDVPGVAFSVEQKLRIAESLSRTKVPELEVVAPGSVFSELEFAKKLKADGFPRKISGLLYVSSSRCREEVEAVRGCLDGFDLLMPVSERRKPYDRSTKKSLLLSLLDYSLQHSSAVGAGFPHSTQADREFLLEISQECAEKGAYRIVVYDTNGSADPFAIYGLIKHLKEYVKVPLFFHAHNDLGLATANSVAAAFAGADGLDVTVNGFGDRAGNASLEQVVMALYLKGIETGIALDGLKQLSKLVERESGVEVSSLAPIVGKFIATHKSPAHLEIPELFEAFDPSLVGMQRKIAN
jgi:homocitrate synthase NifV